MLTALISTLADEPLLRQIISDAVSAIVPVMRERIHSLGLAADSSSIGTYSTKPIYLATQFSKANAVGKRGNSIFKNSNPHRSHYYQGGYREFKSNSNFVNLTLTGQLRDSLIAIDTGIGWQNETLYERALALENKYGKSIWSLTADEKQKLEQLILEKLTTALIHY